LDPAIFSLLTKFKCPVHAAYLVFRRPKYNPDAQKGGGPFAMRQFLSAGGSGRHRVQALRKVRRLHFERREFARNTATPARRGFGALV